MPELVFSHEAESLNVGWDHEDHYKIIDGERQEIAPISVYENYLASRLQGVIDPFVTEHALGRAVVETLFLIQRQPREFQYRPDFAFVSFERWGADRRVPRQNAWDVVPDLRRDSRGTFRPAYGGRGWCIPTKHWSTSTSRRQK